MELENIRINTEWTPENDVNDNIINNINTIINLKQYESFVTIYNKVKEHSHIPEIKKLINKKNILKSLNQTYVCDLCNIQMKNSYKPLHEKTKKHLKVLDKKNKENKNNSKICDDEYD